MLLSIRDLHKSYTTAGKTTPVLNGISFDLEQGQSLALMGESGSGKSTLLHLASGLDIPDSGQILLSGAEVSVPSDTARASLRRRKIGIVFQQFNLIASLDAASNIAFQARLAGTYDPAWCASLADRLGLASHLNKYPEALSGGQQQRVAIARALAARPALLMADEPTGNLDEKTAQTVLGLMLEITRETDTALLMVTHSAHHASALAGQIILRDGKIRS